MKIYISSIFWRREEMKKVADQLTAAGFELTSSWVDGDELNMADGDIAMRDLADLEEADAILAFTEPKGSLNSGGGRHVEFGVAIGLGKYLYFICEGEAETVFHGLPWVQRFHSLQAFIAKKGPSPATPKEAALQTISELFLQAEAAIAFRSLKTK